MSKKKNTNNMNEVRLEVKFKELHEEFRKELELFDKNFNNNESRNKLVKAFCKVLKYHLECVKPALNKVEYYMKKEEKVNYDACVNLDNFVDYFMVVLAREGVWLDQAVSGHKNTINLEEHVDPKLRKYTYNIDGYLITYPEKKKK